MSGVYGLREWYHENGVWGRLLLGWPWGGGRKRGSEDRAVEWVGHMTPVRLGWGGMLCSPWGLPWQGFPAPPTWWGFKYCLWLWAGCPQEKGREGSSGLWVWWWAGSDPALAGSGLRLDVACLFPGLCEFTCQCAQSFLLSLHSYMAAPETHVFHHLLSTSFSVSKVLSVSQNQLSLILKPIWMWNACF